MTVTIPVPGTDATITIDEEKLEREIEERRASLDDFKYVDAHNGDNYGRPKLTGR